MGRLGLVERLTPSVRTDLVDDTRVASACEDVALRIDRETPDVSIGWIKEHGVCAGLVDLVDLAVRGCGHVDTAAGCRHDRVHLEFLGVKKHGALAVGVDAVDLPFVSAANEDGTVRRARERPEKRRVRFVLRCHCRSERESAVGIDRHILDVALQELGFGGHLPERGKGRLDADDRGAHHAARDHSADISL